MKVNLENVGVLEVLLMIIVIVSMFIVMSKDEKKSIIGRILAFTTLLSYVNIKLFLFFFCFYRRTRNNKN